MFRVYSIVGSKYIEYVAVATIHTHAYAHTYIYHWYEVSSLIVYVVAPCGVEGGGDEGLMQLIGRRWVGQR